MIMHSQNKSIWLVFFSLIQCLPDFSMTLNEKQCGWWKTQRFCGYIEPEFNSNPDNVINSVDSLFMCKIGKIAMPSQMVHMRWCTGNSMFSDQSQVRV